MARVVVLHGSMCTGYNHVKLAEGLADAFTVYLPDRRDRRLSGPYNAAGTAPPLCSNPTRADFTPLSSVD